MIEAIALLISGSLIGYFIGWSRGFNQASRLAERTFYAFIESIESIKKDLKDSQ